MGRKLHYRRGSFYRADDRTGFPTRAERTRQEWNGLIVDMNVWESRQPQDLVRGVKDDQSVPDARPLAPNVFVGPFAVQLTAAAGIGALVLEVNTVAGISLYDSLGVMLGSGELFYVEVVAIGADILTIGSPLPYFAPNGNLVYDYGPEPWETELIFVGSAPITFVGTGDIQFEGAI